MVLCAPCVDRGEAHKLLTFQRSVVEQLLLVALLEHYQYNQDVQHSMHLQCVDMSVGVWQSLMGFIGAFGTGPTTFWLPSGAGPSVNMPHVLLNDPSNPLSASNLHHICWFSTSAASHTW